MTRKLIFLLSMSVPPALWAEEHEYKIFDIRNDLIYIEIKLPKEAVGTTGKVYKSSVELPDDGSGKKRFTKLVIGPATVAEVEAEYAALRATPEMISQIAKGDIVKLDVPAAAAAEEATPASTAPAKPNQLFVAGNALTGDYKFYMGEVGYRRAFDGTTKILNVLPEYMAIEFRPLNLSSSNYTKTAFSLFYKFTFFSNEWLFFNTGIQFGLDKDSPLGGGLVGAGLVYKNSLRFEANVEWLSKSYADTHGKLIIFPKDLVSFIIQTGALSMNGREARTDYYYNYSYYSYSYTTSVNYYERFTDLAYFTAGMAITTSNLRLTGRGGLAGTKLDNLGLIARAEIAYLF